MGGVGPHAAIRDEQCRVMDTPLKILLIENDEVDRKRVRRALEASGLAAELEEVMTGRAAVDALQSSVRAAPLIVPCWMTGYPMPTG
jgi:PleD family two-component response regulator